MTTAEHLPKISVVVPSYNQGRFLEECLLSIHGQGYPNLEILLLDGGSSDCTAEIIQQHRSILDWWRSAPDGGQAAAINEGMARATGQILCWLNSDDMLMPGTLLRVGRALRENTDKPRLLYGAAIILDQRGGLPRANCDSSRPFDRELLTYLAYLTQPSSFWTSALWKAAGELEISYQYVMDWEWFQRASQICPFEYDPQVFSIYRRHPEHKSGQSSGLRRKEVCQVVQERAPEYWKKLFSEVHTRFEPLRARAEWLERWRVPLRRKLMPFLAPSFLPRVHNLEDLGLAVNMQR